jgi:hypothetical protein
MPHNYATGNKNFFFSHPSAYNIATQNNHQQIIKTQQPVAIISATIF